MTAFFVRVKPREVKKEDILTGMSIAQAMHSRVFWILLAGLLLYSLSTNGLIAHLSALLTDHGVSTGGAAMALSVMGASGIIGRVATGHLLDRFFAPRISLLMLLLICAGFLLMARAHSAAVGIFAAGLLGFGGGSEADVTPYLLARYCGVRNLSLLYGCTWTAYAAGGAIGPVLVGRAFDHAGGYQVGLVQLLAVPCLIAAALTLWLPRYNHVSEDNPTADTKRDATLTAVALAE